LRFGETLDAETTGRASAVAAEIQRKAPSGVVDVVPAFGTVAVFFDPAQAASFDALRAELESIVSGVESASPNALASMVELPVCYGDEHGPDSRDDRRQGAQIAA
jgi:allophanate hydrolase subunit 1